MTDPDIHPIAALFPMLSEDDIKALADDIATNGLLHPITVDQQDRIVDGRNRAAACQIAHVEPTYVTVADEDAVALILSANLQRRHLNAGQRAMLAARARSVLKTPQTVAAAQAQVSKSRVHYADVVLEWAPRLADEVIAGTLALNDAYAEAQEAKRQIEQGIASANLEAAEAVWRLARLDVATFLAKVYPDHRDYVDENVRLTVERIDAAIANLRQIQNGL